jgi:hypothetical protein
LRDFMRDMLVASMIEDELRCLPKIPKNKPLTILLDPEHWEKFIWEINTAECLSTSEVKYMYVAAVDVAQKEGIPQSKVFEISCPNMMIRFRRNPHIKRIRIIYKTKEAENRRIK